MIVAELINTINDSVLNDYSDTLKLEWINVVNNRAYLAKNNLNRTYTPITTSSELEIEEPYTRIYEFYVYAQINHLNNEISNYNNNIALYNAWWDEYIHYLTTTGDRLQKKIFSEKQRLEWLNTVNFIAYQSLKTEDEYIPLASTEDENRIIPQPYNVAYDYYVLAQQELLSNNVEGHSYYMSLYNQAMLEFQKYMIRIGFVSKQPTFKNIEP